MVKNKDECKEKTMKDKKNKGYKEPKDPLTEKAPRHQAAALEIKDIISDDVAISPPGNDKKEIEEIFTKDAAVADLEKKIDNVEIPNKDEKSVILRYKDSDKFLDAVFQFEEQRKLTVPLDWDSDSDSFLVSVSKEISNEFQNFIKEKVDEIPDTREIDEKIAEVQNARSKSALDKDNSITALKVGKKENPEMLDAWLAHPNLSDLENIDTATEEKT